MSTHTDTRTGKTYREVDKSEVPLSHLIFDTPRSNQGQIVEVSYADGPRKSDEWKRAEDQSLWPTDARRVIYYRAVARRPRVGD